MQQFAHLEKNRVIIDRTRTFKRVLIGKEQLLQYQLVHLLGAPCCPPVHIVLDYSINVWGCQGVISKIYARAQVGTDRFLISG